MRLLPRDERFFDLFQEVARRNVEAAGQLRDLLKAEENLRLPIAENIKRLEHEADDLTHEVVTRLDRTFITPLDREDIHVLASRLDDVMDLIDGTARRCQIFRPGTAPEGAVLLAGVIQRAAATLLKAVAGLGQMRNGGLLEACIEVKRLEEEGDALYHQWLANLFNGQPDPLVVMKWKEIYDNLERTLDHAEDAANVLESIFIKHS